MRYFGPSTSSYWPLLTAQMKKSQLATPTQSIRKIRRNIAPNQDLLARRELPTTVRELRAMAAAATMGWSSPASARGMATTL